MLGQLERGADATNEQNPDEVTGIRALYRRSEGCAGWRSAPTTLSVFENDTSHRSEVVDLATLRPAFFRTIEFLFVRRCAARRTASRLVPAEAALIGAVTDPACTKRVDAGAVAFSWGVTRQTR